MIDGATVLAIIPARGGSKGVPGKNIRRAGGKPLIAWTIEAASASSLIDRVVLSSDDEKIINVARAHGCEVPFVRDLALAGDDTPAIDVVVDVLDRCGDPTWVVLLQPTSPLRTAADIDGAIRLCVAREAFSCVSVCAVQQSPYWMFQLSDDHRLLPLFPEAAITRRQDLPEVHALNGAVYVARADWLRQERRFVASGTIGYEMPLERSLDIDTESDFMHLKYLLGDIKHVPLP
ncbi:MAG: acylneuraminate cytidylyltransferase family protein [Methyloversatilis sp.]|uniref:acylneuraminate cytidylyltransferase family protein n=1 Tax=Methyloversatilis sp. TaxID=2569862 RepID=UPI00273577DE|nr:acylneuraminate cytidylyltransferase family protein [Methyloversatilis sp.]MDP3871348.1 acylneuraminate cytidylyltransferase family protein [Methyloversatilis sp.]